MTRICHDCGNQFVVPHGGHRMFPQIRCLDCEDIHINCDGCGADFTFDSIEIDGKVWHYCNDRCKERIEAT